MRPPNGRPDAACPASLRQEPSVTWPSVTFRVSPAPYPARHVARGPLADMTIAQPRVRMPAFVLEVVEDRAALRTLLACCFVIAAAGLDPHLLDPGMPSVRSALREEPGLQSLLSLTAVIQAGFLLLGGYVADARRSNRIVTFALGGLVVASLMGILMPSGPGLIASTFIGWACTGLALPFAIGAIAMVYSALPGQPRWVPPTPCWARQRPQRLPSHWRSGRWDRTGRPSWPVAPSHCWRSW